MSVIRDNFIAQYAQLHREKEYGVTSMRYAEGLQAAILEMRPKIVLDYGCGQSRVHSSLAGLGAEIYRYDPAIPQLANLPISKADLIINTDVMEHIPAADIDDVLSHMRGISAHAFFFIATRQVSGLLPDGSPKHCTVMPSIWWRRKIMRYFDDAFSACEFPGFACAITTWKPIAPELIRLACAAGIEACARAHPKKTFRQRIAQSITKRIACISN